MTPPAVRVAAVDCGTNSLRLLVAEADADGHLLELDRRLEVVRLGQGIDATGEFHPDALARTFAALERFADVVAAAGVTPDRVHFVATSAARDAGNRDAFAAGVRSRIGVDPDVVSGDVEARLSFLGALSRVTPDAEPVLVMDVGGGSTELVVGSARGEIAQAASLDVGSVRLTERFLHHSPPTADELAAAAAHVDALLAASGLELGAVGSWIGVAGTVTTLAAVHLGLQTYQRELVHGSQIGRDDLLALLGRLAAMDVAQIRELPTMHPQRADVITAGTLVAARVAAVIPSGQLLVSESDILDGIALDLLGDRSARG